MVMFSVLHRPISGRYKQYNDHDILAFMNVLLLESDHVI
jgi:hypothetical protein